MIHCNIHSNFYLIMKINLCVAIAWTTIFVVSVHAQLGLTNQLINYWPFTGNANDVVGTNNGVVSGAVLTTNRFGTSNTAYYFNGSNSIIRTVHPLQDLTNATFSFWVNANQTSNQETILCDSDTAPGNDCYVGFGPVGGNGTAYGFTIAANKNVAYKSATITNGFGAFNQRITNTWLHFVWVMTPATQQVFVNGLQVANLSLQANDVGYHNTNFIIGGGDFYSTNTGYFAGATDDVRIYKRALSTNEVSLLYQYETSIPQLSNATVVAQTLGFTAANLVVGGSYQILSSDNLLTWTNLGRPFFATSTNAFQSVNLTGAQGFFRIFASP